MKFRLTESEFHELIKDSIRKVLRETVDFNDGGEPDRKNNSMERGNW